MLRANLLALAAVAAGLLVFDFSVKTEMGGQYLPLAGLILALYGAILLWWRLVAATRPLQWRLARFARRVSR